MKKRDSELCYTDSAPEQKGWEEWAHFLQHVQIREPVAAFLEASGPLAVIFAQLIYFGQPFLNWMLPSGGWSSLAETLENQKDRQEFVSYLRRQEII